MSQERVIYDIVCRLMAGGNSQAKVNAMLKERGDSRRPMVGGLFVAGTMSLDREPNRDERKVLNQQTAAMFKELFKVNGIKAKYVGIRKQRTMSSNEWPKAPK